MVEQDPASREERALGTFRLFIGRDDFSASKIARILLAAEEVWKAAAEDYEAHAEVKAVEHGSLTILLLLFLKANAVPIATGFNAAVNLGWLVKGAFKLVEKANTAKEGVDNAKEIGAKLLKFIRGAKAAPTAEEAQRQFATALRELPPVTTIVADWTSKHTAAWSYQVTTRAAYGGPQPAKPLYSETKAPPSTATTTTSTDATAQAAKKLQQKRGSASAE
jgi:hypothetical protein